MYIVWNLTINYIEFCNLFTNFVYFVYNNKK